MLLIRPLFYRGRFDTFNSQYVLFYFYFIYMVYVTMSSGYGTSQSFKRSLGGTVDQMGERCSTGDSRRGNRKSIVIVREGEATLCRVRVVRKWYITVVTVARLAIERSRVRFPAGQS